MSYPWRRICERDNWTCQLCGVATPRELRGTVDQHAPEVDHIVPRSRGGTDDASNLRCACRACNNQKLSFLDEELKDVVFMPSLESDDGVMLFWATKKMRDGSVKGSIAATADKDETGKSINAVKGGHAAAEWAKNNPKQAHINAVKRGLIGGRQGGLIGGRKGGKAVHAIKDERGKSVRAVKLGRAIHAAKDESGRSLHALKVNAAKDDDGKSINARKAGRAAHAVKNHNGKSITAVRSSLARLHSRWHLSRGILNAKCNLCWQLGGQCIKPTELDAVAFAEQFFTPRDFPVFIDDVELQVAA